MSPFRPSFKPQSGVYLRLSNFVAPLFSWSYEFLFPQPLCFDNLLRCPPVWGSALSQLSVRRWVTLRTLSDLCVSALSFVSVCVSSRALSTFRINTCKSVSKQRTLTPFRMNTCEKTRGGEVIVNRYGPGTSLTNQTGSIPDTARTLAIACKTSACHGKRAVLWKKSFDLCLSTSARNAP